ncbi:MAG: DASH family cryptochrome [Bacteroidota bacterium]
MKRKRVIVWFRQDLRLHDNEALLDALKSSEEVLPIFIFDERVFKGTTKYGFPKTSSYRAQFIIESVRDLRNSLQKIGSNLMVRVGKPEDILFKLAQEVKSSWIFCNRERTDEEVYVQDQLEQKLWEIGQEVRFSRGKMLYYTADLPFPVSQTPDIFTHFRKEVEKYIPVRAPLPAPQKEDFNPLTIRIEEGPIPTLADFNLPNLPKDSRAVLDYKGGETVALERLQYYLWDSDLIKVYKDTRNELIGGDYSSKFSAWLAQGCLSPKMIYQELKKYEVQRGKNKSTYWLFFELLWRDFFRLMGKKHGNAIFQKGGINRDASEVGVENPQLLQVWIEGRTGIPLIDANMREIARTGFMSNRGRQNVASFLVKDLHVNWQMGADYFESMLIDYDPCSNWGNWNYLAGVGNDPRENRYFNILNQAKRYDPKGEYVKLWCPELRDIPAEKVHQLDTLSEVQLLKFGVKLGVDYPKSMVNTNKWVS